MAPEIKPINVLTDRNLMQMFLQDEVMKGLVVAPKLKYVETDAKRYDFFTRENTSREVFDNGYMEEPMASAPGSELTLVKGSAMQADSTRLIAHGYRYIVDVDDMNSSPESFLMDIEDMCFGLAQGIEDAANASLIANATASSATVNDGVWSTSAKIAEDISGFQREFLTRDIRGNLNTLFVDATNFGELEKYIIATEGIKQLQKNGNMINYPSSMFNHYAPGMTHGSVVGFDDAMPPASVVYRKIPGAYQPPQVKPGTEQYMPVVNAKVIEHDGLMPQREYQFAAVYSVPVQRPKYIFYQTGL